MPTYKLFDSTAASLGPDVFGVWETQMPPQAEDEVSFAVGGEVEDPTPVWSVELPDDVGQAREQVSLALAQAEASKEGVAQAREKVGALIRHQKEAANSVHFSVGGDDPSLSTQDNDFLKALNNPNVVPVTEATSGEDVNFGIGDIFKTVMQKVAPPPSEDEQKFQAVLERMLAQMTYFAAVETKVGGLMIARTHISWLADAKTVWLPGNKIDTYDLHHKTLKLAIESRNALMRMLGLTAEAAVKLSVLLATPGGALLALPAAWKYINQITTEVSRYQALKKQGD